jgi:hypothetical protein
VLHEARQVAEPEVHHLRVRILRHGPACRADRLASSVAAGTN